MPGISAILTAAGESTRMGRPKALLPWRGVSLVEYQIGSLVDGGAAEVVVVLGHQANTIVPHINDPKVRYVVNLQYRLGKTTSIKAGLRSVDPRADAILLLAVDQPRTAQIVSTVIRAQQENNALITSPRYKGHGGHPLIFSSRLRGELKTISEERKGIREVFSNHRDKVTVVEFDDPIIRLDLNTPESYHLAKERYGQ